MIQARGGIRRALTTLKRSAARAIDPRATIRHHPAAGTIAALLMVAGAGSAIASRRRLYGFVADTARALGRLYVSAALARWVWRPLGLTAPATGRRVVLREL